MTTMKDLIAAFPSQLQEAIDIGQNAVIRKHTSPLRNILVTGLGGSGMGANIVIDLLGDRLKVPIAVNKDYNIPGYVSRYTLVIASSYSGNTEETISALRQSMERGAKVVCITSGGKMKHIARERDLDIILLPDGMPPRACLGYSFVQQLFILYYLGFTNKSFVTDLERAVQLLESSDDIIHKEAQKMAKLWHDKLPIIYAPEGYTSVAMRWRQQFNENGKMLCWTAVIPEMNHNELVGWRTADSKWAPIFFDAPDVFDRNRYRIEISKQIVSQYADRLFHIIAKGRTHLQRMMYMNYLGDWISWYMSEFRGYDATEVKVIEFLKSELDRR